MAGFCNAKRVVPVPTGVPTEPSVTEIYNVSLALWAIIFVQEDS